MQKEIYEVKIVVPEGVSLSFMRDYIHEAVGTWCKGMNPDLPIFDLDREKITVKRVKKSK